jgi:hypothetical protein
MYINQYKIIDDRRKMERPASPLGSRLNRNIIMNDIRKNTI